MSIRPLLGIILLMALVAFPASAAWANESYDSCVNVSIKNAGTTTLTWFPAYIEVPYQTGMKANFSDLAFYNAGCGVSGSRLASERANYTPSGTAYMFVEIPTLNVGLTNISILFNNNSPVDDVNRNHTKVWDTNFDGVYHLEEKGDATLRYDSTKDLGSTPVAVTAGDAAGKSASGLNLDGTDAYLQTDENTNVSTAITAEIWFKTDTTAAPDHIIWQGPPAENGWGGGTSSEWHLSIGYTGGVGNELGVYYGTSTGASSVLIRRGGFTDTTNWQYAAFRISNMAGATATGNLWWNQTNITTDTGTEVTRTGMTTNTRLGRPGTASRFFDGIIDEFRLTINTTRSDNWLNNTYQQINSQGSFISLEPSVGRPVVAWNATPTAMNAPFLVNFVDTSTGTPALSSFTWDFNGDGVVDSTSRNNTFTYSTPGTYSVNHSATNALGTRWLNRSNYISVSATPGWYNTDWGNRTEIVIDHNKVVSNLTNFPILVSITNANLSSAQASGNDILFTLSDGVTKVPHEIESFTSPTLVAWVNVSSLSATIDTPIYVYYGNPSAPNQQNPTQVWDSNFMAVYHMNGMADSTSNHYNATDHGSTDAAGQVGRGRAFSNNAYLSVPGRYGNPSNISVSVWASSTRKGAYGSDIISIADNVSIRMDDYYAISSLPGTNYTAGFYFNGTDWPPTSSGMILNGTGWRSIKYEVVPVASHEDIYIDGILKGTTTYSQLIVWSATVGTEIGGHATENLYNFTGTIDEIRVSNVGRTSSWRVTGYNNQFSPPTFHYVGLGELAPTSAPVVSWNATPTVMNAPFIVKFVDTSTGNPPISSFTWDFNGDGVVESTSRNISYTYTSPGIYSVNHSATNAKGTTWLNRSNYINVSATPDWYNCDWNLREQIVIDHNKVPGNQTDFPVLISITEKNLTQAQPDGDDILFTTSNGTTKLSHEIEKFDWTNYTLVAWVKVPSLSSAVDTPIYLYYNNSNAINQQDPRNVWDANFMGVWHLNEQVTDEATSGSHYDSTINGNNGSQNRNDDIAGIIDLAQFLDGTATIDFININDSSTLDMGANQNFTISAWVKTTQPATFDRWPAPVRKVNDGTDTDGYSLIIHTQNTDARWNFELWDVGTVYSTYGRNDIADGNWHHLVGMRIGSNAYSYEDGTYGSTTAASAGDISTAQPLRFGTDCNNVPADWIYLAYNGSLDEVRISKTARSASWILTEYNNQRYPSSFHYPGIEEIPTTCKNPPPIVIFNATPKIANTTTNVYIVDSSTGTNITMGNNFYYILNDGNTSTLRNLSHVFPCTDTVLGYCPYTINHSVTDSPGTPKAATNWSNQTNAVTVYVNTSPTVSFSGAPLSGTRPTSVSFTATTIGPIKVDIWSWTFGDGNTSTSQNPSNLYSQAGQFTVSLTGTNYTLGTTTVTKTNYITVYNPAPTIIWTSSPPFGNATTPIQFTDTSLGSNITVYYWNFNDGNISTLQSPLHIFPSSGESYVYVINHSITDSPGTPWAITAWLNKTGQVTIYKNASPLATFVADLTDVYTDEIVTFTPTLIGLIKPNVWHWEWGDGNTTDLADPPYAYPDAGLYNVSLSVTNYTLGYFQVVRDAYILVRNRPPIVNFNGTPTTVNLSSSVSFVDMSTGKNITSWYWIFNDGNTSTSKNPVHQFPQTGYYTINHSAIDSTGTPWQVSNWSNKTSYIHVINNSITPSFTGFPTSGTVPLSVTFTDTSTGGPIMNQTWYFGDGNTSTGVNPTFIYNIPGVYTVSYQVCNDAGCWWSNLTNYITVYNPAPVVDFYGTPTTVNLSTSVSFFDASTGLNITGWYWIYNDGNTSTAQNPTHQFPQTGYYTINHSATDSAGTGWAVTNWSNKTSYIHVVNNSIIPSFTGFPTSGTVPLSVTFTDTSTGGPIMNQTWYFGDGNTSTAANPTFIYNIPGVYTVSYQVCNDAGCWWSNQTDYITVYNLAPIPNWMASPLVGNITTPITFTDLSSGSNLTAWLWNFNDGNTSTTQNPVHTFPNVGYYTINFTVTDSAGTPWAVTSSLNRTNYIHIVNLTPYANFTAAPTSGNGPLIVTFADLSTGPIATWQIDFGDGSNSTSQSPFFNHVYTSSGLYTVNLTVCNIDGICNSMVKTNYISVSFVAVNASFVAVTDHGMRPFNVTFIDTSTGSPTSWFWDLGDGNTSTLQHPTHLYEIAGNYTVTLSASNANSTSNYTRSDYIHVIEAGVRASFTAIPISGAAPLTVYFTDVSTGYPHLPNAWNWSFGDGNYSNVQNPVYTYNSPGTYTVSLTASNGYAEDTVTKTNYITVSAVSGPTALFIGQPNLGPEPLIVNFIDLSLGNPTAWNWSFGDGNYSTAQNPTHIYIWNGTYTVSLNTSNTYGYSELTRTDYIVVTLPSETCMNNGDCHGFFKWCVNNTCVQCRNDGDCGEGMTCINNACFINVTPTPTPAPYLVAALVGVPVSGRAPLTVTFNDASWGVQYPPTSWYWEFGDGNTSTAQNPVYTYVSTGLYTVNLTVSNAYASNTTTRTNYIIAYGAVTADFIGSPNSGATPLTVTFTDLSTGSPVAPTAWNWSFGDGNFSTAQNPTYAYAIPGIYTVTLNASTSEAFDIKTIYNYIFASALPAPTSSFIGQPNTGVEPLTVTFTDLSSGNPTTWNWSFGEGNFSNARNPTHIYVMNGTYTVSLNVSNAYGYSESTRLNYITVTTISPTVTPTPTITPVPGQPRCSFNGTPIGGIAPLDVAFVDMSDALSPTGWTWDFENDGSVDSTNRDDSHTYSSQGAYSIKHTVTNASGTGVCYAYNYIVVYPATLLAWDSGETWISWRWNPAMLQGFGSAALYADDQFVMNFAGDVMNQSMPEKYIMSDLNPSEGHTFVIYSGEHVNETCCEGPVIAEMQGHTQPPLVLNLLLFLVASILLVFAWVSEGCQNKILACMVEIIIMVYAMMLLYNYMWMALIPFMYIAAGGLMIVLCLYDLWRQNINWT